VIHATLHIAGALFMVHGENESLRSRAPPVDSSSSVVIYLYAQDVDACMTRALDHGARVELAVADQVWGDRVSRIVDPGGHLCNVASQIKMGSA
jgi:PhnB protein